LKHAYIKREDSGIISIRWWIDGPGGVATRALVVLHPGEEAFDLPFEAWLPLAGRFVDIDQLGVHRDGGHGSN
jgi:hypothetical protein